jgi:hypothetical protein
MGRGPARKDGALRWLLEEEQPAMRYLSLTQLLDNPEEDPAVRGARALIARQGWAADLLSEQRPGGWWASEGSSYSPKYISTNWVLLVLADLGLTKDDDARIASACERWIGRFAKKDGGFGADTWSKSHLCTTGNMARALVHFGYAGHPQVRSAFEWLVEAQTKSGGWTCFGGGSGMLDSWEPMSAFAVYPREKWSDGMREAVERGAEFYLGREMHKQGASYGPWYRFHYPHHYYYDLLVGLDFMSALGYGGDKRLEFALSLLKEKRREDGRWDLDAVHPDVEGSVAGWYAKKPPTALALEAAGRPSKMITFLARRVLKRLEG